jgi:hypothetical protein
MTTIYKSMPRPEVPGSSPGAARPSLELVPQQASFSEDLC